MNLMRNKRFLLLIDIVVVLLGLLLTLAADNIAQVMLSKLFQNTGTGLVAAGFVSILLRYFSSDKQGDFQEPDPINVIVGHRSDYEKDYIQGKFMAKRSISIMGIALSGALQDFSQKKSLLDKVLFENLRVRLMFLNPSSAYVKDRAEEDGITPTELQNALKRSIIRSIEIFRRLKSLHHHRVTRGIPDRSDVGSLEIRLFDMCPHSTIYMIDDLLLWGIYTCAGLGRDEPVLKVPKEQTVLFARLNSHFDGLWGRSSNQVLVKLDWVSEVPFLNEKLLEILYGADWKSHLSPNESVAIDAQTRP